LRLGILAFSALLCFSQFAFALHLLSLSLRDRRSCSSHEHLSSNLTSRQNACAIGSSS